MIGAGCVDRIESSYVWMEVFGPLYCSGEPWRKGYPHKLRWRLYQFCNGQPPARWFLGIPYVPVHSMKGSDMINYSSWRGENKVKLFKIPSVVALRMHLFLPSSGIGLYPRPTGDEERNFQMWGSGRRSLCSMGMQECNRFRWRGREPWRYRAWSEPDRSARI